MSTRRYGWHRHVADDESGWCEPWPCHDVFTGISSPLRVLSLVTGTSEQALSGHTLTIMWVAASGMKSAFPYRADASCHVHWHAKLREMRPWHLKFGLQAHAAELYLCIRLGSCASLGWAPRNAFLRFGTWLQAHASRSYP